MNYDWGWKDAEREFERALKLNPNHLKAHYLYAEYLAAWERHEKAIAEAKRAQELDPVSEITNWHVGWNFYLTRRYDEAIEQFHRTLELNRRWAGAHRYLGLCYVQQGRYEEAVAEFSEAIVLGGSELGTPFLGYGYAMWGKRERAREILIELEDPGRKPFRFEIATVYAALGEKDRAFAWLDKAYEAREMEISWMKANPKVDGLRSDARFAELLRRIGQAP